MFPLSIPFPPDIEDEVIAIYDEALTRIGSAYRAQVHRQGLWHKVMHCWLIERDGHVLFQKRSRRKRVCPNLLDVSCAGHYSLGSSGAEESDMECAVREMQEELGVCIGDGTKLLPVGINIDISRWGPTADNEICSVFFCAADAGLKLLQPDPAEVEGLVRISVPDGLRFFRGDVETLRVEGVEWSAELGAWVPLQREVSAESFVPRLDRYYYRVFINAARYLAGEEHICV